MNGEVTWQASDSSLSNELHAFTLHLWRVLRCIICNESHSFSCSPSCTKKARWNKQNNSACPTLSISEGRIGFIVEWQHLKLICKRSRWCEYSHALSTQIFFANKFLFSLKSTCYNMLMQVTIHCHPKLMARSLSTQIVQCLTSFSRVLSTKKFSVSFLYFRHFKSRQ